MGTRVADRVVVDTNVLLAATDESRQDHRSALEVLQSWPAAGTVLYTTGQILREYLVVATRPVDGNGLGLRAEAALKNTAALRERFVLLDENQRVFERLERLLRVADCTGKRIHDANVVATAIAHGIEAVVTANISDFQRFGDHVRVIDARDPSKP